MTDNPKSRREQIDWHNELHSQADEPRLHLGHLSFHPVLTFQK